MRPRPSRSCTRLILQILTIAVCLLLWSPFLLGAWAEEGDRPSSFISFFFDAVFKGDLIVLKGTLYFVLLAVTSLIASRTTIVFLCLHVFFAPDGTPTGKADEDDGGDIT